MKISTKGRYALRLMLDIARHSDGGFVPLRDIADRQDMVYLISCFHAGFPPFNRMCVCCT